MSTELQSNSTPCWNEQARLDELHLYDIVGTYSEPQFDEIVQVASHICETPISLISLIEDKRQWFKARVGMEEMQTPIDISICYLGILQSGLFIIPDIHNDSRFKNNPLVTNQSDIRFYAGAPIVTPAGNPLGMVCVVDTVSKELNDFQQYALKILASEAMRLIEIRKHYYTHSDSLEKLLLGIEPGL
jgi:GAF domain-containing protein